MPFSAPRRLCLTVASLVALALASFMAVVITTAPAQAATITVSTAIATQNGSTATVRGYVVGQPAATNTVVTSNYPNDYALAIADSAAGLSGSALKSALHNIIDGHTTMSYSAVWEALKVLDQDPNNSANVIEFYSGVSTPKTNNGGGADNWNREHTWPQSHGDFGTSNGPGTDVHHLRPEDVTVNSTRGSKDFDLGGLAVAECNDCWTDADSFEPRDSVKGDLARGILYMAVRYNGDDGFAHLEVNNSINGSTNYLGKVCVLLNWHNADPVTTAERARNDKIYSTYQHNRNPIIDHPEYANSIFGATC
jgi:endonuclease I